MKIFVRHLRTRSNIRAAPRVADTSLTAAPIPTSAASIIPTRPSPLRPPEAEPLTRWRPARPSPSRPDAPPTYRAPPPRASEHAPYEATHEPPQAPKEPRQKAPKLKLEDIITPGLTPYAYRWETIAPTAEQMQQADTFFLRYPPEHLWSQAKFKLIDFGDAPEV